MPFADVLDAIERLSLEEQSTLIGILRRRITEHSRKALAVDVHEARQEFSEGLCRPTSVQEIMEEIQQ